MLLSTIRRRAVDLVCLRNVCLPNHLVLVYSVTASGTAAVALPGAAHAQYLATAPTQGSHVSTTVASHSLSANLTQQQAAAADTVHQSAAAVQQGSNNIQWQGTPQELPKRQPVPPKTAKERSARARNLNRYLSCALRWQHIAELSSVLDGVLDGIHVASAYHRLGVLAKEDVSGVVRAEIASSGVLRRFEPLAAKHLPQLSEWAYVQLVRSWVKLRHQPSFHTVAALEEAAIRLAPCFQAGGLASCITCLPLLGTDLHRGELFDALTAAAKALALKDLRAEQHGPMPLGEQRPLQPEDYSKLLRAIARAKRLPTDPEVLPRLVAGLQRVSRHLDGRCIAMSVVSLSHLRRHRFQAGDEAVRALAVAAGKLLAVQPEALAPIDLAQMIWGFAQLAYPLPPSTLDRLLQQVAVRAPGFSASEGLPMVLQALATLRPALGEAASSAHPTNSLLVGPRSLARADAAVERTCSLMAMQAPHMTPQAAAEVLSALAGGLFDFHYLSDDVLEALAKQVAPSVGRQRGSSLLALRVLVDGRPYVPAAIEQLLGAGWAEEADAWLGEFGYDDSLVEGEGSKSHLDDQPPDDELR